MSDKPATRKDIIDNLMVTLDKFTRRIDSHNANQSARDIRFEKLLEWARKVSKKTGIPLENL